MKSRNKRNIKGVDISNWQKNIDFSKVKKDGIEVVIIKATEGIDFVDKRLEEHYNGARNENISIGFYHFMSDKTDPKEQARDFWNSIKNKKFQVIPVLDIEKENGGRSAKEVTNRCIEFLNEFKNLSGYECIIYTYTNFAKTKLDYRLNKYKLWIAHYGVNIPGENGIWKEWVGFQYTDKGKVSGIEGFCDMNEFTNKIFINRSSHSSNNTNTSSKNELWKVSISGDIVKELQRELNKQFIANLIVDGYFGEKTLNKCVNVSVGARGNITKIIQKRLINKGFLVGKFGSDGIFGKDTLEGVKRFQKANKITIDGVVGKNTWKKLFEK
ncbi:GH25 family lysozyme [Eubacterium multiforme]|uniref:Lysozyme n=1 Tax=Eubacterium multiforme TaxID=83339 RepID=A0ABT9UQJ9_9FIRM|nr:GH25 family lysozyme [Eubacterium multiforme]MDQ0148243.1 lysozyme [Eubacterium multiforme]